MDKFVISDTNILIDLINTGLFDLFMSLPIEIHTSDLVISELKTEPIRGIVMDKIGRGVLLIDEISSEQMPELLKLLSSNLSLVDCSVWFLAKKNNWTILTGDKPLRTKAEKDDIPVRGILYIIDSLLEMNLFDSSYAAEKLELLAARNKRLPREEVEKRLHNWTTLTLKKNELCED